ncbi:TonB-dependent receptor [Oceanicoccus sp. KOV_DT_Chl]|uniref:TonB-dependent receptor n=1 Tax=Oceanicoccus sp. KOV_DT_Chl TaxID=1904639 RepID=UPI000C7D4DF1|nr:TonB-dependent receptor [Oceanicoccus sp. KOV_DT_Chl]
MFQRKALAGAIVAASISTLSVAQIEEVIVTATKRSASAQDIPVAIQALGQESLKDLNVGNFDDVVRNFPNLTAGSRGPGQATMYIRGMAVEPITVMLSGAQGTTPNVALYLDEQPVTAPGRNLDIYASDIARVEVLAGPQGTLFGASSQAGTVRLITNKPRIGEFGAGVKAGIADTNEGEMSNSVEGYINIPVNDSLAFRAAVYNVRRGGYIDNVAGEFTTDPAINPDSNVGISAASYDSAANTLLVEDDFNDSYYTGYRLGAKMVLNEDWDLLLQYSSQELGSDGVFDYDPEVGDLEVQRYFPDELTDEFEQTSWTLQGRLDALEIVYTGAYLEREIDQKIDYTGYNNAGGFVAYYTCTYDNPAYITNYGIDPSTITPGGRECRDPVKGFIGHQDHSRQTHEFRINTPQDKSLRLTAGIYYDDFEVETQDDYYYAATPELGFAPNAPISYSRSINDSTRPVGIAFFNDITRTEEQIAVFGELSYDLTNQLTATIGARYYELESDYYGSSNFADGIFQGSVNTDRGRDYDSSGGHSTDPLEFDDVIPKFTLTYMMNQDTMVYGTYSEGYRPGGFNRGGGLASTNPAFPTVSTTYDTDDVVNYEFGWKTTLAGGNVQFNGSTYFIEWTDMQVSRFDPENVSILTFIENAADSEIFGIEMDAVWVASQNLTLFAALSYNDTEITEIKGQAVEIAPEGSRLPLTPEFQGNVRARYEWSLNGYDAYWQLAVQHAGSSYSSIVEEERREQDGYTTSDAAIGLNKDNWNVEFFVENLSDERAELFINNQDDIERITTNRPRTMGMRFSYDY